MSTLRAGCVEEWAHAYVTTRELSEKLAPPSPPSDWANPGAALVIDAPGRPPELAAAEGSTRTPSAEALRDPERRARLLHTFLHHELQAAELMCRALLVFPDTPLAFRQGLVGIAQDEIRHMAMYAAHLSSLGFAFGDFPVNDWFWRRVPSATTPQSFVALVSLGFEGANLDHTQRFADLFDRAGDERGAALQERVGEEEIPHVAFGVHWFEELSGAGPLEFDRWRAALPPPLTPTLMRGPTVARATRRRAGYDETFLDRLEAWPNESPGS